GEFTDRNILFQAASVEVAGTASGLSEAQAAESIASSRAKLLDARSKRPRPHLDNKILTSWNALMISAFTKGYVVLGDQQYLDAAVRACDFILSKMYEKRDAGLLRRFCEGEAAISGFLDDYAFLAQA